MIDLDSPLSDDEQAALAQAEATITQAGRDRLRANLQRGKELHDLKASSAWHAHPCFGSKKPRWALYCSAVLEMSASEADKLIEQYAHHRRVAETARANPDLFGEQP